MIVVPAFAEAEPRHQPEIAGIIVGSETFGTPHVSRRIHKPGAVQQKYGTQEDAPEYEGPPANRSGFDISDLSGGISDQKSGNAISGR